jgi:SAM-dependent methyltransferase
MKAVYDREFFAPYSILEPAYARACQLIGEEIHRRLRPTTVVDWGCGTGLHLAAMKASGAAVLGVDGVIADDDLRAPGVDIIEADLCERVHLPWPSYDLSLCIDVLEHIEDERSGPALENIVRGASVVVLSCAPPGQGGHHHVNERPRRYWVKRMAELGWVYQRRETGAMENHFLTMRDELTQSWMYHNLCIYRPG